MGEFLIQLGTGIILVALGLLYLGVAGIAIMVARMIYKEIK